MSPDESVISLTLVTFISSVSLYWYYFISVKSCDKKIAGFIDSRAQSNDIIIFDPCWFDLPVNYYLRTAIKQVGYPERSSKELVVDTELSVRKSDDMIPIIKSRMGKAQGKVFLVCKVNDTNLDVKVMKSLYYNKLDKSESEMQTIKILFDNKLKKLEEVAYERDYDSISVSVYRMELR